MGLFTLQINELIALQAWDNTSSGGTPGGTYTPSGDETATYISATAMPNQINALGTRANTTQPLEFQNPTTLAWVAGTVTSTAGGNEFRAVLSGVTPGTYPAGTLKMRIVGFPTIYYNPADVVVTGTGGGGTPAPAKSYQFISAGDSLEGKGLATGDASDMGDFYSPLRWTAEMKALLPSTYQDFRNYGQSGIDLQSLRSQYAANVKPVLAEGTYDLRIFFLGAGINDILYQLRTAQQVYDQRKLYIQQVLADYPKQLILTSTLTNTNWGTDTNGSGNRTNAEIMAIVNDFNTMVRNGQADLGYHGLVDFQADNRLQDPSKIPPFHDGLHFEQGGNQFKAAICKPVLEAVVASGNVAPGVSTWVVTNGKPIMGAGVYQESNAAWLKSGAWFYTENNRQNADGGEDFIDPGEAGYREFNFNGTAVYLEYAGYNNLPTRILVKVDNGPVTEIFTNQFGVYAQKYAAINLPPGNHTLRIEHPGTFAEHGICDRIRIV